jgi:hypothetical protein
MDEEFTDDIPVQMAMKLDGMIRLFDGDMSPTEILSMDIPSQRVMIRARLENLKRSQENYKNGIIDAYSRRYASSMGGLFGGGDDVSSVSSQDTEQDTTLQQHDEIDRTRSLNFRDLPR